MKNTAAMPGTVTIACRDQLMIQVAMPDGARLNFHWTSYWQDFPNQPLAAGDAVDVITHKSGSSVNYLAVRHARALVAPRNGE